MTELSKVIKGSAHIHFFLKIHVKKSQINGVIYDSIDEYEIDGFIAVGGESIVFRGVKKSVGRTYALKFRDIVRWDDFCAYELKTLSRLEKCSTSKLAGIIPEVSGQILLELYRRVPSYKQAQCANLALPGARYFCIVEDFIVGCDLNEYCSGDEAKGIVGHTPPQSASRSPGSLSRCWLDRQYGQ